MTYQTRILSSFDDYLNGTDDAPEDVAGQRSFRSDILARFPNAVMLQVAFPELDFANRWCWNNFGPAEGNCSQKDSRYRVCDVETQHSHAGNWATHWFVKTEYDFGFNEWYFSDRSHFDLFLAFVSEINWGEDFPIQ